MRRTSGSEGAPAQQCAGLPDSEAQFRTLKYRPRIPGHVRQPARRAGVLSAVLRLVQHRAPALRRRVAHPAHVHYGHAEDVHTVRADVLAAALHPQPRTVVRKHPEPAVLPIAAWINKPAEPDDADKTAHSTKT